MKYSSKKCHGSDERGVRLSTDLYFPKGKDKNLPVILIRTPYNKNTFRDRNQKQQAYKFASHGFVVAIQDSRGKFESEGIYSPPCG
jgi:putative CocE/NonD family hydrolase